MTPYELFDVALAVGNRVDVQWGLFITVHLAVLGGIIYMDRPLRLPAKVGAMAIYGGFAALNFRALRLQMNLLERTYQEIALLGSQECCMDNLLIKFVVEDIASGRFSLADKLVAGGHLLMAALVAISVLFDRPLGAIRQELSNS